MRHPASIVVRDNVRNRELAAQHEVPIYEEAQHRGLLRHLVARVGADSNEALAGLVVKRAGSKRVLRLAEDLMGRFAGRGLWAWSKTSTRA